MFTTSVVEGYRKQLSDVNYSLIPSHSAETLKNYLEHGIPPGGFVEAVLSNNFEAAVRRADSYNKAALSQWGSVLRSLPKIVWGSRSVVDNWICSQGFDGFKKEHSHGS
jgi:hypothetical protein